MDILTHWETGQPSADWLLLDADLATDASLTSAVLIALFTEARVGEERGWWGGDIGSRLWTLAREKQTETVRLRFEALARDALRWLIDTGRAQDITVAARFISAGVVGLSIHIQRPRLPPLNIDTEWKALA